MLYKQNGCMGTPKGTCLFPYFLVGASTLAQSTRLLHFSEVSSALLLSYFHCGNANSSMAWVAPKHSVELNTKTCSSLLKPNLGPLKGFYGLQILHHAHV